MAATASCVDRSTVSPFRRANENILPRLSTSVTVARRRNARDASGFSSFLMASVCFVTVAAGPIGG